MSKLRDLIDKIGNSKQNIKDLAAENLDESKVKDLVSEAMNKWYGAYHPTVYVRHDGLRNGVIAGTDYSYDGDEITVTVDSSCIPTGSNKNDDGEYRYNGAFLQGIHGISAIAVSTPPPEIYEPKLKELADEELKKAADEYWGRL